MCLIRVGGDESNYVAITILGRACPNSSDFWDGNGFKPKSRLTPEDFVAW